MVGWVAVLATANGPYCLALALMHWWRLVAAARITGLRVSFREPLFAALL